MSKIGKTTGRSPRRLTRLLAPLVTGLVGCALVLALGQAGSARAAGADDLSGATDLSAALPLVNDTTDNAAFTRDTGETGTCGAFPSAPSTANTRSLWYRYTAGGSGWLTLDTRGSTYDTVMEVYTSSLPSPAAADLVSVACNDDMDTKTPVRQSFVQMPVAAGTTYYIMVRSYGSSEATGTANFSASFALQQQLYVSLTGDDSNVGSLDAPFRTLQRAVDVASSNGDAVVTVLDAGPYVATTINKSLTLVGTGSATAAAFTLTNGATLGPGTGGITAPTVYVNQAGAAGARIQDGVLLASAGGAVNVASGTYTDAVTIGKSLSVQGDSGAVVQVAGGTAITLASGSVTLSGLTIQDSATGVLVTGGGSHVITGTNIISNATGLNNTSGATVGAIHNWWGSSTGPTHASNPGGAGDTIVDGNDVTFSPWCTAPAPTCTPLAGIAAQLVFTTQPSDAAAGASISPAVVVEARDAQGHIGLNFNGPITMTIAANPGGGSLSGNNPVTATNGVATFSDLSISNPGVGYTLMATAMLPGGSASTTSAGFTIYNNPPVANDDVVTVAEDSGANAIEGMLLANDTDDCPSPPGPPDSACLRFTAVTAPANGAAAITGDGTGLTYTPNPDFFGTEVFTYTLNDIYGSGADTAVVTVTVTNTNDPPSAVDDAFTVSEDSPDNPLDVLANDSFSPDPPETLSVIAVGPAANGVILFSSAVVTYTPSPDFFGTDVFTYTLSDGNGGSDTATVTVTVTNVNDPVSAVDDSDVTDEDTPKIVDVLANDRAANVDGVGEPLTITVVGPPTSGAASMGSGGANVIYTPALNFNGTDVFTYTVSDGAFSATATVTMTVNAVNDAPNATDNTATTNEDTAVGINVTADDSDVDGNIVNSTLSVVSGPGSGTVVTSTTGVITYTPNLNFNGTDVFTYRVCDDGSPLPALCDTALVTVTVNAVNDAPTIMDDTATTDEDTVVGINVVANDDDAADGGSIDGASLTIVSGPGSGVVVTSTSGVITYTPDLNFNGTDVFQYSVCDNGLPLPALCGTATVTMTVNAVNDAPSVADDAATTDEDIPVGVNVVANDSDVETSVDGASLSIVSGPANGTVITNATGVITYTPALDFNGLDVFTYRACDLGSPLPALCDTATVTVTVNAVNDPPAAVNDSAAVLEDSGANTLSVLLNDSAANPDGVSEPLTITVVGPAANGVTLAGATVVTYTPSADFFGTDVFTYTLTDGAFSATATVTVAVTPVNDAPSFVKGADQTVPEDTGLQILNGWATSLSPGPANESGQSLTFVVTNTNPGLFSTQPGVSAAGTLTYAPAPNAFGAATVSVTLHDDGGTSNGGMDTSPTQTFTLTVTPVNDPPTANDDGAAVATDSGANPIDVLANDTYLPDPPETLTIIAVTQGANGSVTITGGGTGLTYTPDPGFTGVDTFTYTISDGNGGQDTATVTVTVGAPTYTVFLPLALKNYASLPDLVGSFSLSPANPAADQPVQITVVITNQGTAASTPFWADFYINPSAPPTAPNMLWNNLCGMTPCYGLAWYIPTSLAPGESVTLTSMPNGYCQDNTMPSNPGGYCNAATIWPGAFASGTQHLYLFVDSSNPTVSTGAVLEGDESNNRSELHFLSALDGVGDLSALTTADVRKPEDLPPRSLTP